MEPTRGEILVNSRIPYKNRTLNAQNIGVVFGQRSQLWWALPAIESFRILKDIYQIEDRDYKKMMEVLNYIQGFKKIYDMRLEEISTESVIKKIYEGGVN
jgi:ABC-2 type transport system ATP-binding protein